MGWGLLFFGYFLEYVLGISSVFAPFVHLLGPALMVVGAHGLSRYCRSFARVRWCALVLAVLGVWRSLVGLDELFSLGLPFLAEIVTDLVLWANFAAVTVFHIFLAMSVKELAMRVGVNKNAVRALRNLIMYGLYAMAYLLVNTVSPLKSFVPVMLLLWPLWSICNCVMLYSCYMRIAPANENEERTPSRFAFVNRMRAAFDAREQKAIEADRAYHAENARAANEKKMARMSKKQQARQQTRDRNRKN